MTGLLTQDRARGQGPPELAIDPRIAARWVSVRRDQDRRRRRLAVGALVAVTALVGTWAVERSPVLEVRHVVVRGIGYTSRRSVLTAAGLDHRHAMLSVDLGAVRRRVLALPWVADVGVHRDWPSTVTIDITERAPAAAVGGPAGQPAVVDDVGRVLAVGGEASKVLGGEMPPLPVLQGVALAGPAGSFLANAQGALEIVQALAGGSRAPRGSGAFTVTDVTGSPVGTLSATLSFGAASAVGPLTVVFGTADQLAAKVIALRSVIDQLAAGEGPATINVQVADAPVLTNGKKSTSVSTTQRG